MDCLVDIMEGSPLKIHYWEQLIILLLSSMIMTYQVFELIWRRQRPYSYAKPVRRTEIWILPKNMDCMIPQACLFSTPRWQKKDTMLLILVWFKVKKDFEKEALKNGKE